MPNINIRDAYIGVSDKRRHGKRYIEFVKYNSHPESDGGEVDRKLEIDGVEVDAVWRSECCEFPTYALFEDKGDVRCEKCHLICTSYLDKKHG